MRGPFIEGAILDDKSRSGYQKKVTVKNLRDLQDTKIIACAVEAGAEYIVTGDKDLLVLKEYARIKIITAREFLEILKPHQTPA